MRKELQPHVSVQVDSADEHCHGAAEHSLSPLISVVSACRILLQRERCGGRGAGPHHPAAGRPAQECERLPGRQQARQEGACPFHPSLTGSNVAGIHELLCTQAAIVLNQGLHRGVSAQLILHI